MSDERNTPSISGCFQAGAVDRVASSGLPIGRVAAKLGLNETVLQCSVARLGGRATGRRGTRLRKRRSRRRGRNLASAFATG